MCDSLPCEILFRSFYFLSVYDLELTTPLPNAAKGIHLENLENTLRGPRPSRV